MTTLVANTFGWVGLKGVATWFKNLEVKLQARKGRNATIKELSKLSDMELNDIGIARCDIRYLADKHYEDEVNANLKGWV